MERTLRLTLEYDGSGFAGWARQPDRRTVEGTVGDALDALWPGSAATLAVAGRTDAGVHASHQVLSVVVDGGPPAGRAADALRSLLAGDIAVISAREARPGFHARFSALARRYEYRVLARRARSPLRAARALHHPSPIDRAALAACAGLALGEHDFQAFTPAAKPGARTRRHVTACDVVRGWRRARALDRGRRLPAPHGAYARRDDAPGRARRARRRVVRSPARRRCERHGRPDGAAARVDVDGRALCRRRARQRRAAAASSRASAAGSASSWCSSTKVRVACHAARSSPRSASTPQRIARCTHRRGSSSPTSRDRSACWSTSRPVAEPTRARVVWLRAPAGLADSWELGPPGASCRFVPLPTELAASLSTQLARLEAAV